MGDMSSYNKKIMNQPASHIEEQICMCVCDRHVYRYEFSPVIQPEWCHAHLGHWDGRSIDLFQACDIGGYNQVTQYSRGNVSQ